MIANGLMNVDRCLVMNEMSIGMAMVIAPVEVLVLFLLRVLILLPYLRWFFHTHRSTRSTVIRLVS